MTAFDIFVLDAPPQAADFQHASARVEVWRGGRTDRSTRTMIAEPPRWLVLAELDAAGQSGSPPAPAAALHAWRATEITRAEDPPGYQVGGIVLVSMDIDPAHEDEFNDWYDMEHIPLLKSVPGMRMARRFRASSGTPRYVALYHCSDIDIYSTSNWTRANETPWILRMRRFQQNRTYYMFRSRVSLGVATAAQGAKTG